MRDKGGGGGPEMWKINVTSFMDGPLGVVQENEDFWIESVNLYGFGKKFLRLTDKTFYICHCIGLRVRYFMLGLDLLLVNVITVHLGIFYIVAYIIWPRIFLVYSSGLSPIKLSICAFVLS